MEGELIHKIYTVPFNVLLFFYMEHVFTRAERLFGRKSFSIVLGGGFFLFVPFLFFSSLSPK